MRYPLSPVLADLFMEEFELDSIEKVNLCPNLWLRYINDTFVVRPYDKTALQEFFHHLTVNIHTSNSPWNKNKTTLSPS